MTNIGAASAVSGTQGSNSVWLFTVPVQPQQLPQFVLATANAQVVDGANKNNNYAGLTNVVIEDNSTNASIRSAAFLQFPVPAFNPTNLQLALLKVSASSTNGSPVVLAYVYGITNNNWSESSITWATAPNLAQGVPPGMEFTNDFVLGAGASAFMLGQLVAGVSPAEYTINVTSFLKSAGNSTVSFLLARQARFIGDTQNGDGVSIVSLEGSSSIGPRLELITTGAPQPVTMQSPTINTNGVFSFTVSGPAGYSYQIQSSTDLINWNSVETVPNETGTIQIILDNGTNNIAGYYYRAVMEAAE